MIDGVFHLVHVGNTGAAWSLFTGQSVFLAASGRSDLGGASSSGAELLGLSDRVRRSLSDFFAEASPETSIDRLVYGHVIDFIDLHFGSYIYPTFNVADSGICVGVVLYLWHSLRAPAPSEVKLVRARGPAPSSKLTRRSRSVRGRVPARS